MRPTDEQRKLSGKRLKEEARLRKWSNQDVAQAAGYDTNSGAKIISMIYSGTRVMNDTGIEHLAFVWNLNPDYLRGYDVYRKLDDTPEDRILKQLDGLIEEIKTIKKEVISYAKEKDTCRTGSGSEQ